VEETKRLDAAHGHLVPCQIQKFHFQYDVALVSELVHLEKRKELPQQQHTTTTTWQHHY
jgi:hypothetical protein